MKSSAGACLSQINVVTKGRIDMAMPMAINTFQEGVIVRKSVLNSHVHSVCVPNYMSTRSQAKKKAAAILSPTKCFLVVRFMYVVSHHSVSRHKSQARHTY